MSKLSASACAKINLFLNVKGLRRDGYHDIETVFWPLAGLADEVQLDVDPAADISICCDAPDVPCDQTNTCHRAATAFAAAAGVAPSWRIRIAKRIPVAAGLGGGSSDAAAVLGLLNRLAAKPLPAVRLTEVARGVGADVPFFLQSEPALGQGIGDVLTPVDCPCDVAVVLVNPRFPVSAKWAYEHIGRPAATAPPVDHMLKALAAGEVAQIASASYNGLEAALMRKFPAVEMIREFLLGQGCATARVSGSGPTVFGLCCDGLDTARVASAARAEFGPNCWIWPGLSEPAARP